MTAPRRQKKAKLRFLAAAAAAGALATLLTARLPADAATTGRIVIDSLTGLAINGFDPVAYFTDSVPKMGEGIYEVIYAGAVWRFHNEGNRAAFTRDPDVYAPRFGGYDPVALERGVAVAGHPLIFLVSGNRLYLFSKVENRSRFVGDLEHGIAAAERSWPDVRQQLAP
jgi:hypothetical protein